MACGGGDPLEQEPDADFAIRIVDIGAAREEGVLEGHGRRVTSLAWLPDGDHLVSGSTDHTVRLWNVPTGGCLATAYGLSPVLGVQIAGREGTLRIIDNGIATRNRPLACVFEPEGLRRS
jgi:WD40 repeat protein